MATPYRNFPGRRQLLEALYLEAVNAICDAARPGDTETPGAALTAANRYSKPRSTACDRWPIARQDSPSRGAIVSPGSKVGECLGGSPLPGADPAFHVAWPIVGGFGPGPVDSSDRRAQRGAKAKQDTGRRPRTGPLCPPPL